MADVHAETTPGGLVGKKQSGRHSRPYSPVEERNQDKHHHIQSSSILRTLGPSYDFREPSGLARSTLNRTPITITTIPMSGGLGIW